MNFIDTVKQVKTEGFTVNCYADYYFVMDSDGNKIGCVYRCNDHGRWHGHNAAGEYKIATKALMLLFMTNSKFYKM